MIPFWVIVVYLSLLVGLGIFSSRMFTGSGKDYMLASHSIGPFLLLMSLFGTTMTAFALVGSSGEAFKEGVGVYGLLASSSGIIHSLCFFLIGVKLWSWGRRHGYTTQIQFFRDRLNNDSIGVVLFPILVGLIIPYLLIGVLASGTVIQSMTAGAFPELFRTASKATNGGVPPAIGSAVICIVVLIYVFFGGMRGTAWANAFQTVVFMILGVVTFYVIASELGGKDSLMENLKACVEKVPLEKLTRIHMSKTKFFTYMLVPLSVGMFPHLFQHWLTARSAASFKLPVVCHPIFIMIVWVPCVLIGIWATTLPLPPGLSPNAVLPFLVKTKTTALLGGFLTAGILAAIMSSLDSQFLCIGTMFTNDIVGHYKKEKQTNAQQVWTARMFVIGIVAVTYGISLLGPKSVFAMGVWCFTGFAALSPMAFAAVYWRRLTAHGAFACVFAMAVSWSYFFYQSDLGDHRAYAVEFGSTSVTNDLNLGDDVTVMLTAVPINGDADVRFRIVPEARTGKTEKSTAAIIKLSGEHSVDVHVNSNPGSETTLGDFDKALKYHNVVRANLVVGDPQQPLGSQEFTIDLKRTGFSVMPVAPIFLCSLLAMVLVSLVTSPPSEATLAKFFTTKD